MISHFLGLYSSYLQLKINTIFFWLSVSFCLLYFPQFSTSIPNKLVKRPSFTEWRTLHNLKRTILCSSLLFFLFLSFPQFYTFFPFLKLFFVFKSWKNAKFTKKMHVKTIQMISFRCLTIIWKLVNIDRLVFLSLNKRY